MYACINPRNFCFYSFSASVSFDFETQIMSTCMSTSRSNYTDMSIWKKHADHTTTDYLFLFYCEIAFWKSENYLHQLCVARLMYSTKSCCCLLWSQLQLMYKIWLNLHVMSFKGALDKFITSIFLYIILKWT